MAIKIRQRSPSLTGQANQIKLNTVGFKKEKSAVSGKKKENQAMKESLFFALGLIGEIGFAVAIPLLIFIRLGQHLDNKYGTGYYIYLGIAIATILIVLYLRRVINRAIKGVEELTKENNNTNKRS